MCSGKTIPAVKEADEINDLARSWEIDYTKFEGGIYSSEWFWAKILHVFREDTGVLGLPIPGWSIATGFRLILTGNTDPKTLKRSRCAAGHKAMWHEAFGGLPSEDFLTALDPALSRLRERFFKDTYTWIFRPGL